MKPIYLYCLIPTAQQDALPVFGMKTRVKSALLRVVSGLFFRIGHPWWRQECFLNKLNSNRGDIAIRESIVQLILQYVPDAQFMELGWGSLSQEKVKEINESGSLLLVGGGGYLMCNALGDAPQRLERDLALMRQLTVPIVYQSVGFNLNIPGGEFDMKTLSTRTREVLRAHGKQATLLSVRDETTLQLFASLDIQHAKLVPDPVIFMTPATAKIPRKDNQLQVGFNLAIHGGITQSLMERNFATYVAFLQWLRSKYHARIHYFQHEEMENILVRELFRRKLIDHVIYSTPAQMLNAYANLDFHVCQMMHSSIMAFNCGVPAVCLSYDIKNAAFYRLIGQEDLCLPAAELTFAKLKGIVDKVLSDPMKRRDDLRGRKAALWLMEDAFLRELAELVGQKSLAQCGMP